MTLAEIGARLGGSSWASGVLVGAGVFVVSTVVGAVVVGGFLVLLPPTYFTRRRPRAATRRGGVLRLLALVAKNLAGGLLVALGLLLSLPGVPGQGLLTILIGVTLLDVPGRRRLERAVLRRPGVLPGINRLRAWFGRPPMVID